jgi:hypothetical protein
MSELHFKGKEFVYNHHFSTPYRPWIAVSGNLEGKGTDGF